MLSTMLICVAARQAASAATQQAEERLAAASGPVELDEFGRDISLEANVTETRRRARLQSRHQRWQVLYCQLQKEAPFPKQIGAIHCDNNHTGMSVKPTFRTSVFSLRLSTTRSCMSSSATDLQKSRLSSPSGGRCKANTDSRLTSKPGS